jgi:tetratricopeptide (TPR) repeat protein
LQNAVYALAAIPARYLVERDQWSEAARLPDAARRKFPWTEAITNYARGLGAARAGNPAGAANDIARLEQIRDSLKAKNAYWSTEVEVQRAALVAWVSYGNGDRDQALSQMRAAADLEDTSEKNVVTPGRILPARELLGDMLLDSNRPAEALAEYEASLKHDPKRYRSFAGAARAAVASHNAAEAQTYYAAMVAMSDPKSSRESLTEARTYLAAK